MIHPSQNYVFGRKLGVAKCILEGSEVEVSDYARDPEAEVHYYTSKCGCAWAGTNLQYLEYQYDLKHSTR
jgi:hypothetical protein